MPYLHCNHCHHEWEGSKKSKCDWCGSSSYILEEQTPLEKTIKAFIKSKKNECDEDDAQDER